LIEFIIIYDLGVPMQLDRWKLELKEKNSDKIGI
jgi:hypothetical protein